MSPSIHFRSKPVQTLALVVATLTCLLVTDPLPAQPQPERSKEAARAQQMEQRAKRMENARLRRQQLTDPAYIRQNAWWNDEELMVELELTRAQQQAADRLFQRFLEQRGDLQARAQQAQQDFIAALGTAPKEDFDKHRQEFVEAQTALNLARAELKTAVIAVLEDRQRAKIAESQAWILRSDWTRPRRPQILAPRARQPGARNPEAIPPEG